MTSTAVVASSAAPLSSVREQPQGGPPPQRFSFAVAPAPGPHLLLVTAPSWPVPATFGLQVVTAAGHRGWHASLDGCTVSSLGGRLEADFSCGARDFVKNRFRINRPLHRFCCGLAGLRVTDARNALAWPLGCVPQAWWIVSSLAGADGGTFTD